MATLTQIGLGLIVAGGAALAGQSLWEVWRATQARARPPNSTTPHGATFRDLISACRVTSCPPPTCGCNSEWTVGLNGTPGRWARKSLTRGWFLAPIRASQETRRRR